MPAQSPVCVHSRSCSGISLASAIFRRTSFRTLHVDFPRDIVSGYLKGRKYTFLRKSMRNCGKYAEKTSPCNRECWGYPVLKARNPARLAIGKSSKTSVTTILRTRQKPTQTALLTDFNIRIAFLNSSFAKNFHNISRFQKKFIFAFSNKPLLFGRICDKPGFKQLTALWYYWTFRV